MLRIESVVPESYAAEVGLLAGDRLLSMNGYEVVDLVDYHLHSETDHLLLEVLRQDGELWELELQKDPHDDLGLVVPHPQPRQCGNQCLFCFVHQLPRGMRHTLYIKDEDYRFSYLYGSYITLTNLDETDLQRIIRDRLSPLYISVHTTDHHLRRQMLGTEVPEILPLIERLTTAGIELHCQIVLCPGVNDGAVLRQTIADLSQFYPQVASLAVIPVGLTKFRDRLPDLKKMQPADALDCLDLIHSYQQQLLLKYGSCFVFPADEIYLLAGQEIPSFSSYEGFPQIENGVGLIAQFRQQAADVFSETELFPLNKITLVTGKLFQAELVRFASDFSSSTGVKIQVVAINNDFFGSEITVAGLITGCDLIDQLLGLDLGAGVLIPDVMLQDGGGLFLDDMGLEDIGMALQVLVIAVESSPWGVLDGLEQLTDGPVEIIHV